MNERVAQARLTAVAIVRAMLAGDEQAVTALLALDDDHRDTAHAACGLAASLLHGLPAGVADNLLSRLTAGALAEAGE